MYVINKGRNERLFVDAVYAKCSHCGFEAIGEQSELGGVTASRGGLKFVCPACNKMGDVWTAPIEEAVLLNPEAYDIYYVIGAGFSVHKKEVTTE